tara:strand:+ start:688 stop:924 length:237 start_codon:yes stop_codon:yes gene_type:complete
MLKKKISVERKATNENWPQMQKLKNFLRTVGISKSTALRFEKLGWIRIVNISGFYYITAQSAAEFVRRAEAGEFSKKK